MTIGYSLGKLESRKYHVSVSLIAAAEERNELTQQKEVFKMEPAGSSAGRGGFKGSERHESDP